MAQIKSEKLIIEFSKLFKGNDTSHILLDDQVATLIEVVEATIAELINDPSVIVEVNRLDE